jgi:hypothetical protein
MTLGTATPATVVVVGDVVEEVGGTVVVVVVVVVRMLVTFDLSASDGPLLPQELRATVANAKVTSVAVAAVARRPRPFMGPS